MARELLELTDEKLDRDEELSSELICDRALLLDAMDKLLSEDGKGVEELLASSIILDSAEELLDDKLLDCSDCCWLDEEGGGGFSRALLLCIEEDVARTKALGELLLLPPPQAVKNTDIVKAQAIPRK